LAQDEEPGLRSGDAGSGRGLGQEAQMTTFTMRYSLGHFIVTGPDIEPRKFKSRREAKDWCAEHHPGSPIKEIGPTPKDGRRELRHRKAE
jgi:hypothetical protein